MDEYLSTKQISQILGVQPITVRRWIQKGILPAIALGEINKEYRIAKKDFELFIANRKVSK
ncbi:hypothetical protein A3J20_05360 [Candidatus Gottesmanbacteria bacterium RIFCSPLOWO2_02_FULL_42_29]|nr:MAG: hypothetical protein A3J20_05360 [Candidatus Gottesmanbacteria bacterium RIFCSPLOWO2_02_FULL_42_29]